MNVGRKFLRKTAHILAIVLSLAVIVYAANYLIFGAQISVVELAIEKQTTLPEAVIAYEPYPAAWIPFLAAAILVVGLIANKTNIAWSGWAVLTLFSLLFLFSSGGVLLPLDGVLLFLLLAITFLGQGETKPQTA